jgi:hypothetical protein
MNSFNAPLYVDWEPVLHHHTIPHKRNTITKHNTLRTHHYTIILPDTRPGQCDTIRADEENDDEDEDENEDADVRAYRIRVGRC